VSDLNPVRIVLWGPPASGKTTFLAALVTAVLQSDQELTIVPENEASRSWLASNLGRLDTDRRFPDATYEPSEVSWIIQRTSGQPARRWLGQRTTRTPLSMRLSVLDVPGDLYAWERAPHPELDPLASSHGLIYTFDPVRESRHGDTYAHFRRVLHDLTARQFEGGRLIEGRLPHHLAVCVTKFDNPETFNFARRAGFVRYAKAGEPMQPEVADEDAEMLFREFCHSLKGGDADLMYSSIGKNFLPERVRYFFTSAVGFYADRSGRIWPDDFANVLSDPGNAKIRGKLNPVNVVEPVLWLGRAIKPDAGLSSAP
jgi:hypothetical protein